MKNAAELIDVVRRRTQNTRHGDNEGISDEEILSQLNEAQDMLQGAFFRANPNLDLFDTTVVFSTVANQSSYPLPGERSYSGSPALALPPVFKNSVRKVEITDTGRSEDYLSLRRENVHASSSATASLPYSYCVQGASLLLSPAPSVSGKAIRVTYPSRLTRIDLKRGEVSAQTNDTVSYETLTVASATAADEAALAAREVLTVSVSDRYGHLLHGKLQLQSYVSATHVAYLRSGLSAVAAGEGTISSGDDIDATLTFGAWTTQYPDERLPEECERYLLKYAEYRTFKIDSSSDEDKAAKELSAIEADITGTAVAVNRDWEAVPELEAWLE
jgi:hypothetical protein